MSSPLHFAANNFSFASCSTSGDWLASIAPGLRLAYPDAKAKLKAIVAGEQRTLRGEPEPVKPRVVSVAGMELLNPTGRFDVLLGLDILCRCSLKLEFDRHYSLCW
jgi:hypothetical protein